MELGGLGQETAKITNEALIANDFGQFHKLKLWYSVLKGGQGCFRGGPKESCFTQADEGQPSGAQPPEECHVVWFGDLKTLQSQSSKF